LPSLFTTFHDTKDFGLQLCPVKLKSSSSRPSRLGSLLCRLAEEKKSTKIQTKFPWIENFKPVKNLLQLSCDRLRRWANQSGLVIVFTNAINQYFPEFVLLPQIVLILYIGTFSKSMTENLKEMADPDFPGGETGFILGGKEYLLSGTRGGRQPSKLKAPESPEEDPRGFGYSASLWTRSPALTQGKPAGIGYILVTLVACGPLGPSTMSKLTCSPSLKVLNPSS
jgi:hypothetical protein